MNMLMFPRFNRRRSRRTLWPLVSRVFYLHPQKQYMLIVVSAITMATFVFSGLLLFRQSDHGDMMTRGQWLMKQGKAALAVEEFQQLVRRHKNSYEGHLELGKAYMEINEPRKAAKEFQTASRLRASNPRASGAHVAISRYMIAQGKFEDAEKQLFQAYRARKENRRDPELLLAFVDLYEDWGDTLLEETPPQYEKAFLKYSAGLRFVRTVDQEAPLKEKLVKTATMLAGVYDNNKEYDKAIVVLKRALHFEPTADNMVAIANQYEEKEDIDKALYWYQKAYQLEPQKISLKLSSMLMRKAREMNEAHLPKEAEKYFAQAKKINESVKLPLDALYPVSADQMALTYKVNPATFDLTPSLKFSLNNAGNYPIASLKLKVDFMTGDVKLADAQRVVATPKDPLAPKGEPKGSRIIEIKPNTVIPLEDLEKGKLRVRIMVNYEETKDSKWFDVKNAEIAVPEAQTMVEEQG